MATTYYVDGSRTGTGDGSLNDPFKTLGEAADAIAGESEPGNHIVHVRAKDNSGQDIVYNTQHGSTGLIVAVPAGDDEFGTPNHWAGYANTPGDLGARAVLDCATHSLAGLSVSAYNRMYGFDVRNASGIGITAQNNCRFANSRVGHSGGSGMSFGDYAEVLHCLVDTPGGGYGIVATSSASILHCIVIPGVNTYRGIYTLGVPKGTVINCLVGPLAHGGSSGSPGYGIQANTVLRCTVVANQLLGDYSTGILADALAIGNLVCNCGKGIIVPAQSFPGYSVVGCNAVLGCPIPIEGSSSHLYDNVTTGLPVFVDAESGDFRQLPNSAGFGVGSDFELVAGAVGAHAPASSGF